MARHKGSLIEDVLTLVAQAPWPVGVALAAASFLILTVLGQGEPEPATSTGDIGSTVLKQVTHSLIPIAKVLVPGLFLVGAGASFLSRARRRRILGVASREPREGVEQLSWQDFERLVHAFFERRGFRVKDRGGRVADGGIDLELERDGRSYLVQCKHWRGRKVGVSPVRELYGVMKARGADGGLFVTSGAFTEEALYFASNLEIELIDGPILREMLAASADRSAPWSSPVRSAITSELERPSSPACPRCGQPMLERRARRGPNSGSAFWGCPSFPECRGTRSIEE